MKAFLLTYTILCGADSATSQIAFNRGAQEVWLPTQNPAAIHASIGASAALGWQLQKFEKTHPKLAKGLAIGLVASRAVFVVHNLQQLQKGQ